MSEDVLRCIVTLSRKNYWNQLLAMLYSVAWTYLGHSSVGNFVLK